MSAFEFATERCDTPANYTTIDDLVAEHEQEGMGAELAEGRRWVADTFYGEDGDTVRTLRLRKGWSLNQLAEESGIYKPYLECVERGSVNVTIDTCRKLAKALEIDLNTLDQVIQRQDAIIYTRVFKKPAEAGR